MKRTKYLLSTVLAVSLLGFSSCDDYLDKLPDNRMELKSTDDVSNLLVSAYSSHYPAYLLEMYSDNTDCIDNTGWTEYDKFQGQAYRWEDITEIQDAESPQELWNAYYKAISSANASIEYIAKLSDTEKTEYSAQLGEALLCRAYGEFMLSTVFCDAYDKTTAASKLGLPYPEHTETVVGQKYNRGTLEDLYKKIDADIQVGLPLVGNTYSTPKFHFTQKAAYAFATRFYLYYQDYDKAIDYATKALGDNPASQLRDWASLSSLSMNDQVQTEAYVNSGNNANLLLQTAYSEWGVVGGPYSTGDRYAHGKVLATTETLQAAGPWGSNTGFNYKVWSNSALSKYFLRKIPYEFEYTDLQAGIGYAHSIFSAFNTDMLLMERAEAYALKGEYQKAVDDVNTELSVFSSRNVTLSVDGIKEYYKGIKYYTPKEPTVKKALHPAFTIDAETQEPVLQCILQLKRILSMHEGLRMQDVKRYGIVIYRRTLNKNDEILDVTDSLTVDDPRRAIQLPQDVINSGLEANPRTK
mgnify:FL=1